MASQSLISQADNSVSQVRARIPQPLTSLVGREAEIESVMQLVQRPENRLVTVTGPGGVGKTRVALEVARQAARHYGDGAVFVSLAATGDLRQFEDAVCRALGIRSSGDLIRVLAGRQMLLVLDNFEQIASYAPRLTELLSACANIVMLVTSRVSLHVTGEVEYPLAPLPLLGSTSVASPDSLGENAAATLFIQRAQAINPAFELSNENAPAIAEICRRLDGLPLAIELAASRTRVVQPHDLLARLDHRLSFLTNGPRDAPVRQQTLRDTIAWSYDLLESPVQQLFRYLSVFRGGWSLAAAAAITTQNEERTLAHHTALLEAHLIHIDDRIDGESRFQVLETIREFGAEKLYELGELHEAQRRHAEWFAQFAGTIGYGFNAHKLALYAVDVENNEAALAFSASVGNVRCALATVSTLAGYWFLRGALNASTFNSLLHNLKSKWRSGDFLESAYCWAEHEMETPGKPSAYVFNIPLWGVGWIAQLEGDWERSNQVSDYLLGAYEHADNPEAESQIRANTAFGATQRGNYTEAVEHAERALRLFAKVRDEVWTPHVEYLLGTIRYYQGNHSSATEILLRAHDTFRKQGHGWSEAGPLTYLARIARDRGELNEALNLHRQALTLRWRHGDLFAAASNVRGIAELAMRGNQPTDAARLLGAAAKVREDHEQDITPLGRERYTQLVSELQRRTTKADFRLAWDSGYSLAFRDVVSVAMAIKLDVDEDPQPAMWRHQDMSPRELEVLRLMADGLTTQEIADRLFISPRTVSTHRHNIYGKLDVNSQSAAVAYAYRHELV